MIISNIFNHLNNKVMKKYLLFATTAAMMLASCTSEVDFTQQDLQKAQEGPTAIQFGTYMGRVGLTRTISDARDGGVTASITGKQSLAQHHGFGVFAYLSSSAFTSGTAVNVAPNFMYNQHVKGTDAASPVWTYSPVKYWPNGIDAANDADSPSNTATESAPQYLNFYAYAPYTATAASGTDAHGITAIPTNTATDLKFTYTLPSTPTADNCVDFLWGLRGTATYDETDNVDNTGTVGTDYNVGLTKQSTAETVDFLFKHALAKIGAIKVVADIDGNSSAPTTSGFGSLDGTTLVTLEEISIKDAEATVVTSNKFDISTGQWSTTSGDITKASSGATVAADIKAKSSRTTGINASLWEPESGNPTYDTSTSKWTSPGTGVPAGTPDDIYSTGNYSPIMFIPGSGQKLAITVKYVVRTYDAALDAATASGEGQWTKVTQTITNNVTLPNMQPNTSYTLVMHLGLTSVKFSAEVSNWDGGTNEVVWLPSNVVYTTSTTVAAGGTASANVAADATSFTINLTGATNGHAYTASITPSDSPSPSMSPASGTFSSTTQAFTANISANTGSSARTFTITITDTTASPNVVTTVTITQAAGSGS